MLTIGLSTLLFLAFAGLGNLLLIMNETAYMLVPLYAVLLLFGRLFYREANCKAGSKGLLPYLLSHRGKGQRSGPVI